VIADTVTFNRAERGLKFSSFYWSLLLVCGDEGDPHVGNYIIYVRQSDSPMNLTPGNTRGVQIWPRILFLPDINRLHTELKACSHLYCPLFAINLVHLPDNLRIPATQNSFGWLRNQDCTASVTSLVGVQPLVLLNGPNSWTPHGDISGLQGGWCSTFQTRQSKTSPGSLCRKWTGIIVEDTEPFGQSSGHSGSHGGPMFVWVYHRSRLHSLFFSL
jgi:hypothetical protein